MAPTKKGSKRAQEAKEAPVEKKQKLDSKFKPVIEGIGEANALSDSCRQMLLAAIPGSLGIPSDAREEAHHAFVDMIGQALEEVEASLQQAFDEQKSKLEEAETSKTVLVSKLEEAKTALNEADEIVQLKKLSLADKARALSDAKAALNEKKEAQRTGNIAVDEAADRKAALDKILDTSLKIIVGGEFPSNDADAHYKALVPFLGGLTLDDSLRTALPITCVKVKAQRGAFDNMVIEELEKTFFKQVAGFAQILDEAAPKKAERDAAVGAAETHVEDAQTLNHTAAEELSRAQESAKTASDAVNLAEAEVASYEPERSKIVDEKDRRAAVLENFKQYNKAGFELLRDHTSKPVAASQEQPALAAVEEKVEPAVVSPSKGISSVEVVISEAATTVGGA